MENNSGYNTPEWKAKRLKILERDQYKCAICQRFTASPHVHHISYLSSNKENSFFEPWKADDEQLVTLCREHHDCFRGTKCTTKDYIFLPANPSPILLIRHCRLPDPEEFWDISDLMIPNWDDEYDILLNYRKKCFWKWTDKYKWNLRIALLYPETSKMWKKLIDGETIEGKDEIEEFLFYSYYNTKDIESFDCEIRSMVDSCDSLVVNYKYMHKQFEKVLINNLTRPTKGYVLQTKNNKRERSFTLYNLETNQRILLGDFINDEDFKKIPITTANEIGALYAYAYLNNLTENSKYIEVPLFLDNSAGMGSVRSYLLTDDVLFDEGFFSKHFNNIPERLIKLFVNHFRNIKSYKRCSIFEWKKQWGCWSECSR